MNILDENIVDSQRQRLRHWCIPVRHMGYDVGRQGMKDQEILALLHRLRRPTFFTRGLTPTDTLVYYSALYLREVHDNTSYYHQQRA